MVPKIPTVKLTLDYPIYTSDFDPQNDAFLLVGGGGGEGRSGVGNKITLVDASQRSKLRVIREIDLSREEDSVMSLAISNASENSATAFAGINSSSSDQKKGKNEHLRSFRLSYPKRRDELGSSEKEADPQPPQALGQVSLFEDASRNGETYQRVLRLSQPDSSGYRLGAIATGLASFGEIVVFDATKDIPMKSDIRQRIKLQKNEEAADIDLLDRKKGKLELIYCTEYDVGICTISSPGKANETKPVILYTTPHGTASSSKKRSTFRAIRFLTPRLLALVSNLPGRTGTDVLLMEVPEDRSQGGRIILRKRLHSGIKSATSLSTVLLPGATPKQNVQHVLAIAGQDISISLLTLDHNTSNLRSLKLKTFTILKDVHPVNMTSLSFSSFAPPKDASTAPAQYLKLASTSMGNTIVMHRLPLMTYPPFSREPVRYCLSSPAGKAEVGQIGISILITIVMAAIGGVLIQAMTEIRGGGPEYLGAKNWLSDSLREKIAVPYMFADAPVIVSSIPPVETSNIKSTPSGESASPLPEPVKEAIRDWSSPETKSKPLILHDTDQGILAENHHSEEVLAEHGRRWEDLEHHERHVWKKRLVQASEWSENELETVLKGVFFGELAGAVAGAIRG